MKYAIYLESGKIHRTVSCRPENIEVQLRAGESYVEWQVDGDDTTHYVVNGELVARPSIPDLNTVPAGTTVRVNGQNYGVCDDGVVEIQTAIPGEYKIVLKPPFPYMPYEETVVVE